MELNNRTSEPWSPSQKQGGQRRFIRILVLFSFVFLCLIGSSSFFFVTSHHPVAAASHPPAVGINLYGISESDPDLPFADVFKTTRYEAAPNQSSPPSVDANGWPLSDFQDMLWDGAFVVHTSGTYKLKFNGLATLALGLQGGSINNQTYDASTNTTTADVALQGDSSPRLIFTNTQRTASSATNTGVTNIQMMRPTTEGSTTSYSFNTVFTTALENFVRNFQAIRFMDFTGTNANPEANWSDRVLPQARQEGRVSWEYVIQLCNETGKDGYINVPEKATDDYITHLANLIKYGSDANGNVYTSVQSNPAHAPLNSNLHLYIEYSNEVWNGSFQQMHDNHDAAVAEVNAGNSPLNYDGDTNEWNWTWRRIAKRIHDISQIFRSIFGDAAMPPDTNARVRPIFEWQYGNAQDTAHQGLSFLDNYYDNADGKQHVSDPHPVGYFLWGGGGAAYSGVNNGNASTIDGIYNSGYSLDIVPGTISTDAFYVHAYGLQQDVAYEGGFDIGGDSPSLLQQQANQDPRAQQMELTTQTYFNQAGGDLLMYFNSSGFNYGMARPTVLDSGPKLLAIQQINQSAEADPNIGTLLPAVVPVNSGSFVTGNRVDTLVNSPSGGTYSAALSMQTSTNANTLQVLVNNVPVQTVNVPQTTQQTTSVTLNSINLQAGLNGISFRGLNSTNTNLYSLTLSDGTFTPTPGATPIPTQQTAVAYATTAPAIDGNASDALWSSAASNQITHMVGSPSGLSASFRTGWDNTNLYMLVNVQDSTYSSHPDAIEVYLDPNHDSGTVYDNLDMQYVFPSNSTTVSQYKGGQPGNNTAGIAFANSAISGGYQMEAKIPWSTLGVSPSAGNFIGLDLDVQQNTTSTTRAKLFWNATVDNDWTNPSLFGLGQLQSQGTPTPTPTPTSTPTPTPTPVPAGGISINAGGPAAGSFVADTDFTGGTTAPYNATIDTSGVSNPAPQAVYQSERYGNFTYTIPQLTAGATYTVRLHFAELYWSSAGKRVFNVSINGSQVLTNFDIYATAGAQNKAVVKSYTATASSNGQISLQFSTVTDNATVDGIEVLSGSSSGGGSLFASSFESSDPALTWSDSVDNAGYPAGGISSVSGICCGLTGPEGSPRSETAHTGSNALMYSGYDNSSSSSYAYLRVFDLSSKNITVGSSTMLEYWIYPQSTTTSNLVSGSNSTCIALDVIFSNGTNLRDSGAVDQNGNAAHPASQCNKLTLNSWNHIIINLGAHSSGLSIVRLDLGYDQPANTGGYRGYIDDVSIHN